MTDTPIMKYAPDTGQLVDVTDTVRDKVVAVKARTMGSFDVDYSGMVDESIWLKSWEPSTHNVRGNAKRGHTAKALNKRRSKNKAARKARRNNRG